MSALENAKNMSVEDILAKTAASGLLEFGVERSVVTEKWNQVNAEREFQTNPIRVVAGLNNADIAGVQLEVLKADPKKVMEGMAIAALAVDAEEMYLYLPEKEAEYAKELEAQAAEYGIQIQTGIINRRASRGGAFHHILTMAALADIFTDSYEPCTYMAVCKDGKMGELQKVSFGTKVAELVGDADVKAIAIGTKLYDASAMDLVIEADTQIGNGVITVYSSKCCMIHETEEVLLAERKQSCGKCTFCREGLIQLHTMVKEITEGQGKKEFTDMMEEIGEAMTFSTPCTMGQTASDFAMGSLKYFAGEYEDHIKKKKCANNVCSAFMSIYIDPDLCEGCEECADVCPADAIEGKSGYIHMIDEFECTKCGKCISACENDAIIQTNGRLPKLPTRLTKCGKFKKRH